jgi:hypothetical protein
MTAERAINVAAVAGVCESIGRNCEFGLVQRRLGLEPVSLLRWGGGPMAGLVRAIETSFFGLAEFMTGDPEPSPVHLERRRWALTCQMFDLGFHVETDVAVMTAQEAANSARPRMKWQAHKFLDRLRVGAGVLVYSSGELKSIDDVEPLVTAIRRRGPSRMLIVVKDKDGTGEVRDTCWPGVWVAEMPRLTEPLAAMLADYPMWDRVLANFGRALENHVPISPCVVSPTCNAMTRPAS